MAGKSGICHFVTAKIAGFCEFGAKKGAGAY